MKERWKNPEAKRRGFIFSSRERVSMLLTMWGVVV